MQIVVVGGPMPSGQAVPEIPFVERFVRRARRGEVVTEAPCAACGGTGNSARRVGGLLSLSSCMSCRGTGVVKGVELLRAVGDPGAVNVTELVAWARESRVRTDLKLLLEDEQGADVRGAWVLRWCGPDAAALPTWRDRLCGRVALAVAVEADADGIVGHVAAHAVTESGRVNIVGMWDLTVDEQCAVHRAWSSRRSRWLCHRSNIAFPVAMVARVVREVVDLLGSRQTPRPHFAAMAMDVPPLPMPRILPTVAAAAILN